MRQILHLYSQLTLQTKEHQVKIVEIWLIVYPLAYGGECNLVGFTIIHET